MPEYLNEKDPGVFCTRAKAGDDIHCPAFRITGSPGR